MGDWIRMRFKYTAKRGVQMSGMNFRHALVQDEVQVGWGEMQFLTDGRIHISQQPLMIHSGG